MPIIFSSDGYFLQEYFSSTAIKIHALSDLNIPHDTCIFGNYSFANCSYKYSIKERYCIASFYD